MWLSGVCCAVVRFVVAWSVVMCFVAVVCGVWGVVMFWFVVCSVWWCDMGYVVCDVWCVVCEGCCM